MLSLTHIHTEPETYHKILYPGGPHLFEPDHSPFCSSRFELGFLLQLAQLKKYLPKEKYKATIMKMFFSIFSHNENFLVWMKGEKM